MRYHPAVLLLNVVLAAPPAVGQDGPVRWDRFRGPNGSGVAAADKPPIEFGPSRNLLWKTPVSPGHSSPIIWEDHVFLTAVDEGGLAVIALRRRDGSQRWRRTVDAAIEKVHAFSNAAASTAATDGQRVYAYFGSFGVLAYDFEGQEAWRRPLATPPTQYGTATSPIVADGKVILQRDGNDGQSELLALDARTGAVAWRTARTLLRESWSTPSVWSHEGEQEIVTMGTNRVVAYSPRTGEERWWVAGLTLAPITLPVAGAGLLFASSTFAGSPADPLELPRWDVLVASHDANQDGKLSLSEAPLDSGVQLRKEVPKETPGSYLPMPTLLGLVDGNQDGVVTQEEWQATLDFLRANEDSLMAMRPGGAGDSTKSHVVWKAKGGLPEMPSPLFLDGRLYLVRDGGLLTVYSAGDGTLLLDRRRLGVLGQYVASPVAADGRIYAASHTGIVVVFRAGDTLDVLARNDLGEEISATPAIADHKLYIRTDNHLWAFGER